MTVVHKLANCTWIYFGGLMSEVTIASELGVKYGYVGLLHGAYIYSLSHWTGN